MPNARKKVTQAAQKMARNHPDHHESRLLLASLALKEGNAEGTRNELKPLLEGHETVRVCTLMAEAETALGDASESSRWLTRSRTALAEPGFTCGNCRKATEEWSLTCPHCGSVGTLA
jgi:uncharacterized membrane-anchored protein